MKKRLLSVLLCTMMVLVAGCGSTANDSGGSAGSEETSEASEEQTQDIVIGVALPTAQEERWVRDREAIEAAAKELGVEVLVQVANNDSDKQYSQIENLVAQGVDAIMFTPVDTGAVSNVIQNAHDEGIVVVNYDRMPSDCYLDAAVKYDDTRNGELIASAVAEQVTEGNYVVLNGDKSSGASVVMLHEGMVSQIQDYVDAGDVTIVADQYCKEWKAEEAMAYMENVLSENNNDIVAVLAMNDGIASGAIQALEAQGLAGTVAVSGMDAELSAAQRIVAGTQTSTLFKDTKELAKLALETTVALVKGEDPGLTDTENNGFMDVPIKGLDAIVVTKDNLDEVLIDGGYMSQEDVYGN
ncbi:MAG: substrate-binding domain-containing protein [Lachnospiraceae bacterium]